MTERSGKTKVQCFSLYPEDLQTVYEVAEALGSRASLSDAIRYIISQWRDGQDENE